MAKAIALIRVSTEEQELIQQKVEVINFAKSFGYTDDNIIIIANKESGVKLSFKEREGIQEMVDAINNDSSINAVIVWRLNRLGRRPSVLFEVEEFLIKHKVNLYTLDGIKLLNDDGTVNSGAEWAFSMLATMAKQEAAEIKAKTARGRKQSVAMGKATIGRPIFGYCLDKANYIQIDETVKPIIYEIFDRYANTDDSTIKIAEDLAARGLIKSFKYNSGGANIIRRIITNLSYSGREGNGKVYKKKYPAIVSVELQDKAIAQLEAKRNKPKSKHKYIYLCKGLVKCPVDGFTLSPATIAKGRQYYKCSVCGKIMSGRLIDGIGWNIAIELYSLYLLNSTDKKRTELATQLQNEEAKVVTAEGNLKAIQPKKNRLSSLYVDGNIDKKFYDAKIADLKEEEAKFNKQIVDSNEVIANIQNAIEAIESNTVNIDNIASISDRQEQFEIVHKVIKQINIIQTDNSSIKKIEIINVFSIPSPYYYIWDNTINSHPKIYRVGTTTGERTELKAK